MEYQSSFLNNELYLIFQPIIHLLPNNQSEMTEFEILLRSKITERYPQEMMDRVILFDKENEVLLEWYEEEMIKICQKHPTYAFNFNIHPQQFLHSSTWHFLTRMKKWAKQINIELTEKTVNSNKIDEMDHFCMGYFINKIKDLGYLVIFDDIGCGQNTLELITSNISDISCLKYSLNSFGDNIDMKTIYLFLAAWHSLAEKHNIRIVVEGVEDKEVSNLLFMHGIEWQQGYYWAKAVEL